MKYLLISLLWPVFLHAQEVVEVNYQGTSTRSNQSQVRQDIFNQATKEISLQYIRKIIGAEKAEKNNNLIKTKIIRNSGKYILFIKGGAIEQIESESIMPVKIKLSLKSLKSILLQHGLLYELSGPPKVLPFISYYDRVNSKSYRWWMKENSDQGFLKKQVQFLHAHLKKNLRSRGFYTFNPIDYNFSWFVPEAFRVEQPGREDLLLVGEFLKSSIMVRGNVQILPQKNLTDSYVVQVKLEALHTSNGRVIGEVIRKYETEMGPFQKVVSKKILEVTKKLSKDLSVQLHDAWKRGTFGSSLIKITLLGTVSHPQLQTLKQILLSQVKEIKGIRERYFAAKRVTFEVETSSTPKGLAQIISNKKFNQFKVQVLDSRADGLDLKVKAW